MLARSIQGTGTFKSGWDEPFSFELVPPTEPVSLLVHPITQTVVCFCIAGKKILVDLLRLLQKRVSAFSFLVRDGYLPQGDCGYRDRYDLLYHTYLVNAS